jgi:hypothetical protein
MNRDVLRQISVILITIVTLIVNGLATSLPLNGVTTAKLSDSYWIRFVPAGRAEPMVTVPEIGKSRSIPKVVPSPS